MATYKNTAPTYRKYDTKYTKGSASIPEIPRPINKKQPDPLRDFEYTGEFRTPKAGEWIVGQTGYPRKAGLDYYVIKFHILRRKIEVMEDEDESTKKARSVKNSSTATS